MLDTAFNGPHAAAGTVIAAFTMAADTGSSIEIGKAGVTAIFTMKIEADALVDWSLVVEIV
jgi:hypothetical protein